METCTHNNLPLGYRIENLVAEEQVEKIEEEVKLKFGLRPCLLNNLEHPIGKKLEDEIIYLEKENVRVIN